MKALVKTAHGVGNVSVMEMEKPALCRDDWVLIKIKACGVCGTDIHVWQEKFMNWPPVILGHELSGEIVEAGNACNKFKVGDHVVAEPGIEACGKCEFCRSGRMHLCYSKLTLGWRINGGMTEYITMPEQLLHKIPDGLSYEIAALCEPMAVAVHNVAEGGFVGINDYVVVQGSGPIGALSAYVAKRFGARKIIMTGIDASEYCRFNIARKLGVSAVVNVLHENLHDIVMEQTDGMGADCVIETSGAPSAIAGSVGLLKKNGRIIGTGIPFVDNIFFPWRDAVLKALSLRFFMSTSYTAWDKALCYLEQDSDLLKSIVTWSGSIDGWERIFNELMEEKQLKAVFTF